MIGSIGSTQTLLRPIDRDPAAAAGQSGRPVDLTVGLGDGGAVLQPVRAEVRDGRIIITPETGGVNGANIPNTVGAEGVLPSDMSFHRYDVQTLAPNGLQGRAGLDAVGAALRANPTPGNDQPASANGTRNDVGDIAPFDGDDNFVRTFTVPSPDPARYTDIVVNYTQKGEHTLDEGFVIRYGELNANGSISLRSYGEGNAWKQNHMLEGVWGGEVQRVWGANHREIFDAALGIR